MLISLMIERLITAIDSLKDSLSMPSVTDWGMFVITLIYAGATIFIMLSNKKTADFSHEQLEESKKQFNETHRLQVMPYLQIKVSTVDESKLLCSHSFVQINLSGHNSKDASNKRYSSYITKSSNMLDSIKEWSSNTGNWYIVRYVALSNLGDGIAHHIKTSIQYDKQEFNIPGEYIIPAHNGTLGAYILINIPLLDEEEIASKEKEDSVPPAKAKRITAIIHYQDILENQYKQNITFMLLRYEDRVDLISNDFFISAPQQVL